MPPRLAGLIDFSATGSRACCQQHSTPQARVNGHTQRHWALQDDSGNTKHDERSRTANSMMRERMLTGLPRQ